MAFTLAPGISYCMVSGSPLFLDVRADRYFGLAAPAERSFLRLVRAERGTLDDRARLTELIAKGLLRAAAGPTDLAPCAPPPPPTTALTDLAGRVPRREIARSVAAILHARRDVRHVPLDRLVARMTARKSTLRVPDAGADRIALAGIAAAMHAAGLWIGAFNQCLAIALAATRRAAANGLAVELVMGVKLRPFQAHAWAQSGAFLLSDRVERVGAFTPIRVI